jgi:hypothetical protein
VKAFDVSQFESNEVEIEMENVYHPGASMLGINVRH